MYRLLLHMDQALYSKATEIAWKHTSKYANIILRMGTFHTIMTLLAIIGKRFQDSGLRDTCIESGIIAEGSVHGVLEGRMYKRAVRVHKIIYEAALRLAWKGFITWLEAHHPNQMHSVSALPDHISDARGEMSQAKFDELLSCSPSGCHMVTRLVTSYLDWSARQEVVIGNFTCLPSGKCFHGTLPMTD